jgi:hypothetical protein
MPYKNSVRASQERHDVSAIEINRLMLFKVTTLFIMRTIRNTAVDIATGYGLDDRGVGV